MNLSTDTIDKIVANVLNQISPSGEVSVDSHDEKVSVEKSQHVQIHDKVVTAEHLERLKERQSVEIVTNAIITPAAQDVIREKKLVLQSVEATQNKKQNANTNSALSARQHSVAIVKFSEQVDQAISELQNTNQELLSCPDDAAKFAISELCRTASQYVFIFAEQTHRAACLSNRNSKAKAVVVSNSGDVKSIRKQLRANVWCIDPTNRTYFELKNILKTICSE